MNQMTRAVLGGLAIFAGTPCLLFGASPPIQAHSTPVLQDRVAMIWVSSAPRGAELYVDGLFVGSADSMALKSHAHRVAPGSHQLILYHPRYHSLNQVLSLPPGAVYALAQGLAPLTDGEAEEPRPSRATAGEPSGGAARASSLGHAWTLRATLGAFAIQVEPDDAEIVIDGEPWRGPAMDTLVVHVQEGLHTLMVRRSGYRSYVGSCRVEGGTRQVFVVALQPIPSENSPLSDDRDASVRTRR